MHGILFAAIAGAIYAFTKKTLRPDMKFRKALIDLYIRPGRSLLVIFALFTGLWGVGTILISYYIMNRDLPANYLRSRPAHVILESKDFARLDIGEFRKNEEIENAEFRDFSLQRIEVYPDRWLTLWLYGVEDFKNFQMAELFREEGDGVPERGSILIERDGLKVSSIRTGSEPRLRTGSKTFSVPVSGIVFDPAQAPATQDAFIYAYTDKSTFREITEENTNERLILRLKNAASRSDAEKAAEKIIQNLKENGITVTAAEIPKFNEHPHQWQLNTILALEGVIGFLAFAMGMVLVSQLMNSIMAQQIRQTGMMKATGASSSDILKIYLFMIMTLGIISASIAIPLAVRSGYAFSEFVSGKLNFNIITLSLPAGIYILLISIGIFLPVIFAFPAVWRGTRISVIKALNDFGTGSEITPQKYWIKTGSLTLPFSLLLSWRNIIRRKKRMLVTSAMMALGVAIFSTGFNVRQALENFLFESGDSMRYDVKVVLKTPVKYDEAVFPFQGIKNIKRIEAWNGGTGRLQSKVVSLQNGIGIVALPHRTDLRKWDVLEGSWLDNSEKIEFVLNQQAAMLYDGAIPGRIYELNLNGNPVSAKLKGIIREFDPPKIYMDQNVYDTLVNPEHLVNSLMITAEDRNYEKVLDLVKDIEKASADSSLSILYVMSHAERSLIIFNHLNIILTILIFLSLLVLAVSALGMASSTGINILERTREIGVLRAIGGSPSQIHSLFVQEGMILSLISIFAGAALSIPLSIHACIFFGDLILGNQTSLDFAFSVPGFLITLLITTVFAYIASRIPAGNAVRIPAVKALQYE